MEKSNLSEVIGWKLRSILADSFSMNASKDNWTIRMGDPVLHFKSAEEEGSSIHWQLSWVETKDGDDVLLIDTNVAVADIPHYRTVPEFEQPIIAGSAVFLEDAVVQKVTGYGFHAVDDDHLTAVVIHTAAGCMTIETGAGGVMAVTMTDVAAETLGDVLLEIGR
ncbi:hypothetical protein NCCP2716_28360 [Sporosarcina sp. NCCP-2716]|uniref:hypothetical protein n=1 Tax=Sporosarcina sp. NCCP-2716 TaxID=2943679 RepID=UPI00203CF63D|nr:hypothetical protein [Sporosarcina sp. NCCP-2716]GKV70338.1 hypothetical protein NCCP2716_28360 [Sporosarcina sp. NCCP-2716]